MGNVLFFCLKLQMKPERKLVYVLYQILSEWLLCLHDSLLSPAKYAADIVL